MKAKWLICNLGKDDHIQNLYWGVREIGREAEVISLKEFAEMVEKYDDSHDCVVTAGSIWMNGEIRKQRPNWSGNWHDESLYDCTRYYAYWGDYITQQEYVMMPFGEMMRRKDWLYKTLGGGPDNKVFFRPDSGGKEFTGSAISYDQFDSWAKHVLGIEFSHECFQKDLLCVAAKPLNLQKEIRLVICRGKVVTGSAYRMAMHQWMEPLEDAGEKDDVIAFAEGLLAKNLMTLPPVHTLDVAIQDSGISVLEVGCFCCAGLYMCNRKAIAEGVSLAAEEEFERKGKA
jgi:hypothetical protein